MEVVEMDVRELVKRCAKDKQRAYGNTLVRKIELSFGW